MSLTTLLSRSGPTGFGAASTADEVVASLDLTGKTVLITGPTSGIGLESARSLASRGARLLLLARDAARAQALGQELPGQHLAVACELGDPGSVERAVARVLAEGGPIDAILANAGIMALPQRELVEGIERQFYTNHLGHFRLVLGLLPALTAEGRVVMVSSAAHQRAPREGILLDNLAMEGVYTPWSAYGQSKLANLLFARELGRRFKKAGSRRLAIALHPGVIATKLTRHMNPLVQRAWDALGPVLMKSPQQGAATQVFAAVHPGAAGMNGEYMADVNLKLSSRQGKDMDLAARLWAKSEELTGAKAASLA